MDKESDLYPPVKALLQAQGYTVKGEIGAADIVGVKEGAPPVVVELKLRFALGLFHQAIARLRLTDHVYIAVPRPTGKSARRSIKDNTALCRRLGLGLIFVLKDGRVDVQCDPGPYVPRKATKKKDKLLREFHRLEGDPNAGGATRHGIVTAYRQDALRCAAYLAETGAEKGSIVAKATGVKAATSLMRINHYGWFEKVETGIYALTKAGRQGLKDWAESGIDG
jgi:hypothetical protein